jgi:hypothetical protein
VELAGGKADYEVTPQREDYAALLVSLAKQEYPDTSAYTDPEIVWRMNRKNHVGLIVRSASQARVAELLDAYVDRISRDYGAFVPPPARPTD